jgi:hypothetical protein
MGNRALSTSSEGNHFQPCLPNEAVVSAEHNVAFTDQHHWKFDVRLHCALGSRYCDFGVNKLRLTRGRAEEKMWIRYLRSFKILYW